MFLRKGAENNDRDAVTAAEAATRPPMRFVALMEEAQLDMRNLHHASDRLLDKKMALASQLHAVLLEHGIVSLIKACLGNDVQRGWVLQYEYCSRAP